MLFRSGTIRSGIWSALLQWSRLGLGAVVFLVVTRWLPLTEIGAFGAALAPLTILLAWYRSAVPDAVVQEGDPSPRKISTLFWIANVSGIVGSLAMFAGSFVIGYWIKDPHTGQFLAALSVCPICLGIAAVPEGLLRKSLDIKSLTVRSTAAMSGAAAIAIGLAYNGFGGWALVMFTIVNTFLSSALVLLASRERLGFSFDRAYCRTILPVLFSLVGSYGMSAAVLPILQLLISANLGLKAGGAFQIALRIFSIADSISIAPIRFIALPAFAKLRFDQARFEFGLSKVMFLISLIAFPFYMGMMVLSPELLPTLLGPVNAAPTLPVFQALCLYGPPGIIVSIVGQALLSRGLAVTMFKRSILMFLIATVPCALATMWSVTLVAILYSVLGGFGGLVLTLILVQRHCGISMWRLLGETAIPFVVAVIMALAVEAFLKWSPENNLWVHIAEASVLGAVIYVAIVLLIMLDRRFGFQRAALKSLWS